MSTVFRKIIKGDIDDDEHKVRRSDPKKVGRAAAGKEGVGVDIFKGVAEEVKNMKTTEVIGGFCFYFVRVQIIDSIMMKAMNIRISHGQ